MDEANVQSGRKLLVQNKLNEVSIFTSYSFFTSIFSFGEIEAVKWVRVLLKKSSEVSASWYGVDILLLFEDDIWFWGKCVGDLTPKERDWSSYLNKRCNHRSAIVETVRFQVRDLFNFNEVCGTALLINASTEVTCASKVTTSTSDQQECEFVSRIFKILEVNWSVNDRHNPLFAFDDFVHISY